MWFSSSATIFSSRYGAGAVLLLPAHDDAGLETVHHLVLDRQVGLELLAQRLADAQREEALVVRQAVQQQDAVGDRLGVPHFVERFSAGVLRQLGEAPVLLHLGMQKILVDRGELTGQLLVEQAQNIRITLHDHSYGVKAVMSNRCRWAGLEPTVQGCSSTLPCRFRI